MIGPVCQVNLTNGMVLLGILVEETEKETILYYPLSVELSLGEEGTPVLSADKYCGFDFDNTPVNIRNAHIISLSQVSEEIDTYFKSLIVTFNDVYDETFRKKFASMNAQNKEETSKYH